MTSEYCFLRTVDHLGCQLTVQQRQALLDVQHTLATAVISLSSFSSLYSTRGSFHLTYSTAIVAVRLLSVLAKD